MGIKATVKKVNKIYGNGKLEKACFVVYKKSGGTYKVDSRVEVQFNPSEYDIRRGVKLSEKKPLGRDTSPDEIQTSYGGPSTLSVSLYFDSYTELLSEQSLGNKGVGMLTSLMKTGFNAIKPKTLPSFDMNEELSPDPDHTVNERFNEFLEMIKYDYEEHEPPYVGFIWGDHLHFVGKMASNDVQYTLFARDGTPVRARISMQLVGEDISFVLRSNANPFESPDRTKQRTLRYGDQLWMLAQEEYGNPARWKTIAEANGILNPRVMSGAVRLKVPSIR